MAIRFAVLALLAEQPLHGYALHAALEERLADLCEPAYGDVYRALTALTRDGLAAPADERVGRRPRRRTYTITPAGLSQLRAWLVAPPASGAPRRRDDLALRVLLAERAAPDLVSRVVAVHAEQARAELADLLAQRAPERAGADLASLLRALRLEDAIRRARVRIETIDLFGSVLARHRRGVAAAVLAREVAGREPQR